MISEELIEELQKYGLSIVKKERCYCLVDVNNNEWYEDMSIHYIYKLISDWNTYQKMT